MITKHTVNGLIRAARMGSTAAAARLRDLAALVNPICNAEADAIREAQRWVAARGEAQ